MNGPQNSVARTLAVVGLVASLIALIAVISSSSGGGGGESGPVATTTIKTVTKPKTPSKAPKDTYVVRPGDSLSTIADKSGVSVEQLTLLNSGLDPQALISGQCVVLRESGKDKCK